jgi:hypothetical protein
VTFRRALVAAVVMAATVHPLPASAASPPPVGWSHVDDAEVDAALGRAVEVSAGLPHTGTVAVASFSELGPQVTQVEVTRGEGSLRFARDEGWEVGRAEGTGFLASSSTLLRVGGVERVPAQLDRLRTKYDVRPAATAELDTGPARALEVVGRGSGVLRERLYLDDLTGLIVRRETFDTAGEPIRVVAYTDLAVEQRAVVAPEADGRDLLEHGLPVLGRDAVGDHGFEVPDTLPAGYELLAAAELDDTSVPTLHLLYGDGLYTVSVFQQRGRLSPRGVRGATQLESADGGAVWRWSGSEPRRMVWSGDGTTFTALSDAPTDELLTVIGGLPTDPPPSILDRLARGLHRVGRWLLPSDRSDT